MRDVFVPLEDQLVPRRGRVQLHVVAEYLALHRVPLAVVVATTSALRAGAKINLDKIRWSPWVELLLPKGFDRSALYAAGFERPQYPRLQRTLWTPSSAKINAARRDAS